MFYQQIQSLPGYAAGKLFTIIAGILVWIFPSWFGVNVKNFGASGSKLQATGSIESGSNLLTVATGADGDAFLAQAIVGNGVYLLGAGSQGNGTALVGIISAKAGRILTLVTVRGGSTAKNASATVSGALLQFDDTDALNEAIAFVLNSAERGGRLNCPAGWYRINKGFDSVTNSILTMPYFQYTDTRYLGIFGDWAVSMWGAIAAGAPQGGTIFDTGLTGTGTKPQVIAARAWNSTDNGDSASYFNHITIDVSGIKILKSLNAGIRGFGFNNAINAKIENCQVETNIFHSSIFAAPNNADDIAFEMPGTNSNFYNYIKRSGAIGQHTVAVIGEHVEYDLSSYKNTKGVIYRRAYRNKNSIFTVEHTPRPIEIDGQVILGNLTINGEVYDSQPTGAWYEAVENEFIYDPADVAHGLVDFNVVDANFGNSASIRPTVTGCSKVKFTNQVDPFKPDDGTVDSLVVARTLPAAPTYVVGAIMIDEFFEIGNINGRRADELEIDQNTWATFGTSNAKINVTGGKAIVIEGFAFCSYDAEDTEAEAFMTFVGGTAINVAVRHTLGGSCYAASFDRTAQTVRVYSFTNAGVGTGLGTLQTGIPLGTIYGFKVTDAGVGSFTVDGVPVGTNVTGLTAHAGTRVGFGGSETVAALRFQIK
jgi:hypothetical protein